jgi:nucleoside 2-deoxyribosyltransferase
MKAFLICSVRGATAETLRAQEQYVAELEARGYEVHYPPRDTNQAADAAEICSQNFWAIKNADEVHVFYSPKSQGTHFDLGMAFALAKKIVVARNVPYGPGKSYARMLDEWRTWR